MTKQGTKEKLQMANAHMINLPISLTHATTWMNVILGESQTQKDRSCMLLLI